MDGSSRHRLLANRLQRAQRVLQDARTVPGPFPTVVTQIEAPLRGRLPISINLSETGEPRDLLDSSRLEYWDLSLQDAIHLALRIPKSCRIWAVRCCVRPETICPRRLGRRSRKHLPSPGVEAALSAFDAEFSASMFGEKNDRRFNNQFLGQRGFFQQDFDRVQAEIAKRTVTGSQFAVRHIDRLRSE